MELRNVRKSALSVVTVGLLLAGVLVVGSASPAAASQANEERWAFCKINDERRSRGLAPLARDLSLEDSSRGWSAQMSDTGRLEHDPNAEAAYTDAHPNWSRGAENVGSGQGAGSAGLHNAFMNSTLHRDNILGATNRLGVGLVIDPNGGRWITHRFIQAPLPANPDFCPEGAAANPAAQPLPGGGRAGFGDVTETAFYADAVEWAVRTGVTTGCTADRFCPDNNVTRAQIATFLHRIAGQPDSNAQPFSDVPPNAFYATPVRWMSGVGLTSGCGNNRYCPDDPASRAQMVTLLWRFAGSPDLGTDHGFGDVPRGAFYEQAVTWALRRNITTGTSPTTFAPNNNVTRGQMVTFLHRYVGNPSAQGSGAIPVQVPRT